MDSSQPKNTQGRRADPLAAAVPVVTCSAHSRSGNGCKAPAIPGGTVCRFHGGSAPQVREAARKRILAFAPDALQVLVDLATSAESEAVRARAAIDLLDRAGLKAAEELAVTQAPSTNAQLDEAIAAALAARQLPSA